MILTRLKMCIRDRNYDDDGIVWPLAIAPYQIIIVPVSEKSETQMTAATQLYQDLQAAGYEVIFDDRNERAGVKFKDADLLGIPLRITVGDKSLAKGELEDVYKRQGYGNSWYWRYGRFSAPPCYFG